MTTPQRLAVASIVPLVAFAAFAALVGFTPASSAQATAASSKSSGAPRATLARAAAFAPTAAFAPVDCAEFGYTWDVAPDEAVCGDVTVPLHHADPRGPTITLAVAVVHRGGGASEGDGDGGGGAAVSSGASAGNAAPLILLQGGPGASTIDAFFDLALAPPSDRAGLAAIRAQRDLVLLDQRGTRYGQPALMCPELVDLTRKTIELDLDPDVYFALEDDAVADCRDGLDGEGIDIAAFNSVENAADIPSVAQALGYGRYSVYGVSYGSLLALHLMRQQPPGLESVVLDGVVPPPIDFNQEAPASLDGSLSALFDACAAAPDCKAAYPNLEATLRDTLDRLDDHPARVPVIDPATGIRYRALVDGRSLLDAVHQLLYGGPDLPIVPRMIDAAARGDDGALGEIMGSYAFDDSLAEGMYMSTVCSEDGDIDPDAVPLGRIRPWLADRLSGDADDILAGCDIWDVPALPAPIDAPVVSDVPTLLMSGRFDPITPPAFAEATARTLSHAQRVVFPAGGHGALGDPCSNALVAAFLADPTAKLDTACAADLAAPDFRTPADTFFSPVPRTMLRLFDLLVPVGDEPPEADAEAAADGDPGVDAQGATAGDTAGDTDAADTPRTLDGSDPPVAPTLAETWAPIALAAFAWLFLVLGTGLWALGRAFGAAGDARWPARVVPVLCLTAVAALPAFSAGFSALLWRLIDEGRDAILYVGVPLPWAPLVWLPALGAAAGLALAATAVWAWRVGAFGARRRWLLALLGAAGVGQAAAVVWLGLGGPVG